MRQEKGKPKPPGISFRLWGEPTEESAMVVGWATPHRDKPKRQVVMPETYPRFSTLELLLGVGGTYGSVEAIRSGGDSLVAGICLLFPMSLIFLYAGAKGLLDCYKAWRTYGGNKNAPT